MTRRYDSPGSAGSLAVLDAISLEVQRGESLAIVGPSGSGKSTLLHLMGSLDRPTSGEVILNGQDLGRLDETQLAEVRNREIGFVFQAHYLLPQCTLLENVLVPTLACPKRRRVDTGGPDHANPGSRPPAESALDRARRLLKRVGLIDRLNHRPGQLSGGERQRVAVVRALINQPQLLLADEPTGALDHVSAEQLFTLLIELNREEAVTLVIVTHALDLARRLARVLELRNGHLTPSAA